MTNQYRGFTLVELLVSLSVIGVLLAMLLPAAQSVREAARRIKCLNNLRQTGLAVQNFASARGHFPTAGAQLKSVWGITTIPQQVRSVGESGSWLFQILPFLEQQNAYSLRDAAIANGHVGFVSAWPSNPSIPNSALDDVVVESFICPSRGQRRVTVNNSTKLSWVCGDYAAPCGVWGIDDIPPNRTLNDGTLNPDNFFRGDLNQWGGIDTLFEQAKIEKNFWIGLIKASGTVAQVGRSFKYSRITYGSATDGLSNTVLAVEKSVDGQTPNIDEGTTNTSAAGEILGIYAPNYMTNMRFLLSPTNGTVLHADHDLSVHRRDQDERGPNGRVLFERGFGSPHPDTASSMWGDGSVHSVSMSISAATFYDACHRNDGYVFDRNDF